MPISATVEQLDAYIKLLRDDANALHHRPETWAEYKARQFEAIGALLRQVRQDKVMTGMDGKRIE